MIQWLFLWQRREETASGKRIPRGEYTHRGGIDLRKICAYKGALIPALIALMLVAGCRSGQPGPAPPLTGPESPVEQPPIKETPPVPPNLGPKPPAQPPAQPPPEQQPPAQPPQPPVWPEIALEEVVHGLAKSIGVAHAGDGSGRLFVVEQPGRVRIIQDGRLLAEPFLDIRRLVTSSGSEQGLLSVAFHPRFAANGLFYVNYTGAQGATQVVRYQVSQSDPNMADPNAAKLLLTVAQPYANHNGGDMKFGPDGYLYIGLGDGGSAGDPHNNGQRLDTLLGKMLRIDVDGGDPYAIPPDNPFLGQSGRDEIWAYGLRNPWRFSFDRLTGDLWIADVGQNKAEEINFAPAGTPGGQNYGWNLYEGSLPYREGSLAGAIFPVAEYSHDQGCSVTGGHVYRGQAYPTLQGHYLYGDFCSGRIWSLVWHDGEWRNDELLTTGKRITSFGEDESGEIYLLDHDGVLYQVVVR